MKAILTVDDSPSVRRMVAFTLWGAGNTVVQAVDDVDRVSEGACDQRPSGIDRSEHAQR
jgi:two-component system chemotaxis response regulator CheY